MLSSTRIQSDQSLGVLTQPGEPRILLLHGLAGHRGEWLKMIEELPTDVGLIVPDLRGHGSSFDGQKRVMNPSSFIHDLAVILDKLATGPVTVVGHSIGGVVATLLAAELPHLVSNLVLVEAGMEATTSKELRQLKRWFKLWPNSFADERSATSFFGADAASTPAWVGGLRRTDTGLVPRFDKRSMLETAKSLGGEDRWTQWQSLPMPTTLIRSSKSAVADGDIDRMLGARPDTALNIIDDASHDVHLDQPEQVAAVIAQIVRPESS